MAHKKTRILKSHKLRQLKFHEEPQTYYQGIQRKESSIVFIGVHSQKQPTTASKTKQDANKKKMVFPRKISNVSSRAPSPTGVIVSPQGGKASNVQDNKTKQKGTFCMKIINSEVNTREEKFPKEKCGEILQIYLKYSLGITSALHSDKNRITKEVSFGNPIIIPKFNRY